MTYRAIALNWVIKKTTVSHSQEDGDGRALSCSRLQEHTALQNDGFCAATCLSPNSIPRPRLMQVHLTDGISLLGPP